MTWRGAEIGAARRRRSLRVVIVALSGLVLLVAVLGTWQVLAARSSQRTQILDGELTAARLASNTVSSAVTNRLQLLENLAGQPGSSTLLEGNAASELAPILDELLRLYPEFSAMSVVDSTGKVLAQVPATLPTPALSASREQAFRAVSKSGQAYATSAFERSLSGDLALTLTAPVKDSSGIVIGMIEGTVSVSSVTDAVGGTHLNGGGTLLLADQAGHVITGPAASSLVSYARVASIGKALHGSSGTASGSVPGFTGTRLVAFAPVKSLGWAVVVENSQSALGGPVAAMTERLGGIGAAVVVFAVATAMVLWLLLRQLGRQRDEVAAIIASVGEGVATIDASGRVLKINPALELLTGRRAASVQGRPWSEVFVIYDEKGNAVPWPETVVAHAIRAHRVVASRGYTRSIKAVDGRRIPVAVTASPLFIEGLVPSGAVVVIRDVSREQEVDQLKSSLVSTVSHELRTPLTLIQGFSELLLTRSNLDSAQSKSAASQIHASSQRLGRLIDDLLSVSRIESGRLNFEVRPLDLSEVVSEVVESFAVDGDHRFATDIQADLGRVLADRDKTLQILTNLVSNAVKYSPSGSEVRISARRADHHVEVDVTDEGIGMTRDEVTAVFEKFSRSDRAEVRKVGGTGLGLYITKSLVELQGGEVWIHSEPGAGSTFTFTLPLEMVFAGQESR
jgi:PAS domain S-box-containing protein